MILTGLMGKDPAVPICAPFSRYKKAKLAIKGDEGDGKGGLKMIVWLGKRPPLVIA